MDNSIMLLISLNRFFCCYIPNYYLLIITWNNICCSWWKLTITNPILMFFQS